MEHLFDRTVKYLNERFAQREEYARGTAIGILSAIAGNSLRTDKTCHIKTKANIYTLICGPSGTGKSSMIDYGLDLIEEAGYRNFMPDDITSEAITPYLANHPSSMMRIPEFSGLLGAYRKKSYLAGLQATLTKAYDGTPLIQGRSTKGNTEAKNFALTLLTDIQPLRAAQEIDESDVSSGFLPRFLWFHQRPPPVEPHVLSQYELDMREELINDYKSLHDYSKKLTVSCMFSQDQVGEIYGRTKNLLVTDQYHFEPFYQRLPINVYKLAMLYMFSSDDFKDIVDTISSSIETDSWSDGTIRSEQRIPISNASISWSIEFIQKYLESSMPETLKILNLSDADKVRDVVERYQMAHEAKPMPQSLLYSSLVHTMKTSNVIRNAIDLGITMNYIQRVPRQGGLSYRIYDPNGHTKELEQYEELDPWSEEHGIS